MTPDLMPLDGGLYSGREQRRGLVNPDTWNRLSQIETQTKRSGFAEQQLDHQASAMWLAGKVDRPYEEVSNNLDSYGREYFGADVNASQIYDRIVSHEQNARKQVNDLQRFQIQGATPQATQQATPQADAGAGKAEPEAKDWQFMRTGVASLGQVGSDTIGGTMATIEGLLNTLGGVPDKPKASENPEYLKDIQNLARLEVNGLTDSAEAESLKDRIALNKQKLDASFLESRKSYEDTIRGGLAGNLRKGADFFYEVSGSIHDFYGSDPAFRDTTIGKAAEMGGSMMGSSALLAAGSLGFMGKIAGVKRIADVAGAGQIYAGIEKDRMNFEGSEYQNTGWTFVSNAASAGVQQFIERAPFLDNTLEKAIKGVPHTGGKINLGQFLRQLPKAALTDGIKEGSEEALQGAWGDFITDMSYNDQMVDMTNGKMDYLKRRTAEALAGFAGGVMLGGTFYTAGSIDVNRAATKAEKLLKHKDGSMLNADDFRLIRQARDDKTIKGMKHGEILLKAANGDTAAMDAYNKEIFNDGFVKTDGLSADGFTIGQFNGMPAVLRDDGKRVVFDPNNSELMSVFNNLRRSVATKAQTDRAIADLQAKFNEQLDVQRPDKLPTIQEMVDAGTITADQAQEIVTAAQELNGLAKDLTWAEITPQGTASITPVASDIESKRMIYRMVTNVLKGANPLVAIEEVSEAWMKKAQAEGNLDPAELRALREQWHAENGEVDPVTQGVAADRADIEWFSNRVMEYAVAAKHTNIVGNWWQWIRSLGDKLKTFINGAQRMRALMKGNKLDPKLESWFKGALGVEQSQNISERQNANYLDNAALAIKASEQARVQRQAELEAVFNDGIPSINAALKTSQQSMLDYEKLKADFQELQRLGKEADLNDLKVKAEQDVDALMDLPLTQLSDQARRALDRWETYSITSTRDPYTTFSLRGKEALDSQINGSQPLIPVSVDEGALLKNAIELAKSKVWERGRDLKQALQDRLLKLSEEAGVDTSLPSPQSSEYLVRVGLQDALAALEENPNAIGWYDEKTRQALAVVSLIHPEIDTDPEMRFAFVWALAVTSNGQKVDKNFELAEEVYVAYKKTGLMPTDVKAGMAQEAVNKSLGHFNQLKAEWGMDSLRMFMMTNFTVSEIGTISEMIRPTGEYSEITVMGAAILGPKVGNGFFSNLYGNFDSLTMDRWLIRTWGRWNGTLLSIDQPNIDKATARLSGAIKALSAAEKLKFEGLIKTSFDGLTISEAAVSIHKASTNKDLREIMNESPAGELIRKAGNGLWKYLDGQNEAPRDPAERIYIRSVFAGILAELNKTEKYANLVMADLQAALWYAEKRLYENAKEDVKEDVDEETLDGYADDEAPDYANAAATLARQKGIKEKQIQTTLKQNSNYGRSTTTRLQQGNETQPVGQQEEARGFTTKERREFIETRAVKRVRSTRIGAKAKSNTYEVTSGEDGGRVRVLKKLGISYTKVWEAKGSLKSIFTANNILTPKFYELTDSVKHPQRFTDLITAFKKINKHGSSVYVYSVAEYAQMRRFVTEDGLAGFAIKPNGDMVSAFSGNKSARAILELGVANGGIMLDAFDTVLPAIYSAHGFKAVARVAWNDKFTPEGWDKKTYDQFNKGEPDVVYMTYDKNHVELHKETDGKLVKTPEAAARAQKRALVAAGIPIKESYSLTQTTSKEFKDWFGESKVVDDQGKPLVVYHGTNNDFTKFKQSSRGVLGSGIYFADSPERASSYAQRESTGGNLVAVFLQIEKPLIVEGGEGYDVLLNAIYGRTSVAKKRAASQGSISYIVTSADIRRLRDMGHDGVIWKHKSGDEYLVFEPTQIKSAIGNKGTFDPSNPDITMSVAEQDPVTAAMNDKFDEIHTKQMQEMGFSEMLKQRNETYVQSIVNAQEKHNSPASQIINKIISPVDELLRRLGVPEIASAMRRNTADINKRKAHDMAALGRLAAKKGAMSEADAFLFDVARSNGDMDAMNTLAEKYDFKSELSGVMSVFDRIRQDSIAAGVPFATFWEQPATLPENFSVAKVNQAIAGLGLDGKGIEDLLKDIGYKLRIENYWPRHVIDYDEYIAYLTGSEVGSSELARAYQAAMARANADGRDTLTADELSRLAEMGLSELTANRGQGKKPSGLKERKIKKIPAEALRFYMKDIDSAYRHVEQMHEYVGALRFFGRNAIIQDAVVDGATPPLNVKETVRMYIEQQSALMNQRQIEDIREALEARFNTVGSPSFINTIRTLGYLQGMTQIYTPLTAVYADFWNVALESNTNMSTFINALYQGVTGKNAANLGDFNLDARTLHREFRTQVGGKWSRKLAESLPVSRKMKERVSTVSLANTLDVILRSIGLNKFNELVQQTRANTQLIALKKSIESGKLSKIQQSRIDRTFREEEKAQLYKDIKDGKGIEDSDMIRYYLWAGIADYMPISMDQMPVTYLTSPRGRVFYMYKTFLIMQTAAIRRESLDRIKNGIDSKDPKEIAAGLGVLLMMISLMQFFQIPPDIIRAYIQNRPYILTDEFIYKLMGLVGFSHFAAQKVKTGDWAGGLSAVLLPPFSIGPDMQKDVMDLYDWPANYSKFDYGKLRLWNYTPVIGRMYQGWEGSDYTKREKEMKNGGFFRVTPDAKKAQRADQSRQQWLFNRYGR